MNDFIIKYYLVIMLVTAFILFALIGYLADNLKKKQAAEKKIDNDNLEVEVENIVNAPQVEEPITQVQEATSNPIVEENLVPENNVEQELNPEVISVSTDTPEIIIPEVEDDEDNNK